ncbi:hypothetical protein [Methylovulum psychrotolerans]|uniref:hypothetical protein n=1 Tax=Methylovulum psychrotolerans TaxID=1704499 RepID=UPI0018E00CA2|nr:hypothetical protein [Methylovulum psychrotolerans]
MVGDPVNFIDPLGLCKNDEWPKYPEYDGNPDDPIEPLHPECSIPALRVVCTLAGEGSNRRGATRTTNPKHHPNAKSPEPPNAKDLFDKSITDKKGRRWAIDKDGIIHRFSKPSNGETHWNGSTGGDKPIRMEDIPNDITDVTHPIPKRVSLTDGKRKNRTLHRLPDLQSRLCNGDGLVGDSPPHQGREPDSIATCCFKLIC